MSPLLRATFLAALIVPFAAEARETGDVRGLVTDTDELPLPRAILKLSGVDLAGEKTVETQPDGTFRFTDLAPGQYKITVEWQDRIGAIAMVEVVLDRSTYVPITVDLSGTVEEVDIKGYRPIVDTTSSSLSTTMSQQYLQDLPVGRSYQDVIQTLPGISGRIDTSSGGEGDGNPSVRGEGQYGNNYMIDGIMMRDPATNTFGADVNYDGIEEITVYTDGAPAEYGQATGMIANIVTKDGGDEHHGSAAVFYSQHAFFKPEYMIFDPDQAKDVLKTKSRFRTPALSATAGGPIVKEKLWYFTALDLNYGWGVPEGLDTDRATQTIGGQVWGKLTWFPSPEWILRYNAMGSYADTPNENAGLLVDAAATSDREDVGMVHNLKANWTPDSNTNLELKVGYVYGGINVIPHSGDRDTAAAFDSQGRLRGNATSFDLNARHRVGGGLSFTKFAETAIGSHRIKAGSEYWYLQATRDLQFTGVDTIDWIGQDGEKTGAKNSVGTEYGADPARGYDCKAADYSDCGVRTYNLNAGPVGTRVHSWFGYLQDDWQPVPQLTLNLGVRVEVEQGINDIGKPPATQDPLDYGTETETPYEGVLPARLGTAPRFGISVDPWNNGKTRFFGTYGWYYDLAGGDFWDWANTRSASGFVREVRDANGNFQWSNSQDPEGSPVYYDRYLQVPRMEKVLLGAERELARDFSVSLRGILSRTQGLTEDVDVDGNNWIVTNPKVKYRMYRGLEVAAEKKFSDNWQLLASYTLSESYGTSPGQFELAANAESGSNANNIGVFLDDIGEKETRKQYYDNGLGWVLEGFKGTGRYSVTDNNYNDVAGFDGYSPYQSFHMVKVNGSYRMPWGTLLGLVYEFDSGHAWQKRTYIPFYGYDGMAQGRGTRFMPPVHYVDVRVAHKFTFRSRAKVDEKGVPIKETEGNDPSLELTLDVFNLPGFAQAITYFDNDAPGFGSTMARQGPRSVRGGVKYRW